LNRFSLMMPDAPATAASTNENSPTCPRHRPVASAWRCIRPNARSTPHTTRGLPTTTAATAMTTGSQLAADGVAGSAFLVTNSSAAMGALAWMFAEWKVHGKPSVLGIISGAVAGLVAITPASGTVGPMGALAIGAAAGVGCYWAATSLKRAMGYDDSLDVFGVHAVGGIIGAMLTGVFSAVSLGGSGLARDTIPEQLVAQGIGVSATIVYTAVVSFIILKVIDALIGLRVDEDSETEGLDVSQHDERGYILT